MVDSEPIKKYEAAPKAMVSNIIFFAAWIAGTTGYFLVRTKLLIDMDDIYSEVRCRVFL